MIQIFILALSLALPSATLADDAPAKALSHDHQWPAWRGPLGTGVAPHGDPPVTWSEDKNIRWKLAIPGNGHSTPIIWGHRIFLTTAIPHGDELPIHNHDHDDHAHDDGAHDNTPPSRRQKFVVLAIDRRDGNLLWQREVRDEQPHESAHETGSWASNSAVTDGEHVYASFGSRGLYALDLDGKIVWRKDLGDMRVRHEHGEGSSPALHGDTLVVNWDHQGDSFVVALDKRNGEERWRTARDEITSWSTPLIVDHGGKRQVIISATKRVRSYDLATGKVVWEASGLSRNVVASPVAANGMVFVGNSYDWQAMLAIRLDKAHGDITTTDAIAWTRERDTPYVPSPVLFEDTLCFLKHSQGFLTCVAAKTGEPRLGPVRLPRVRNIFASPVGADDRIYIASREGTTAVVQRGIEFELLAVNQLDDSFSASPAVVGNELYLRGQEFLYSIAVDAVEATGASREGE